MRRILIFFSLALAFSAIYLVAFPYASIFYEGIVILHIFLGVGFLIFVLPGLLQLLRGRSRAEKLGWIILIAGGAAGTGDVLLTRGKPAEIPVETRVSLKVQDSVTITERLD